MQPRLSSAITRIQPSATLAMTARVAQLKRDGIDIIGLSAGEPDFDTPDFVKEAAIAAIRRGETKYTDVAGTPALREAIAHKFRRDNQLSYDPADIIVSVGGKHVIFNALAATVGPGDEVIIPAPYWVSYPDIVAYTGATPITVSAGAEQGYRITPEQLEAAITPRTRWLILNSPSNPTGAAYDRATLSALGAVLERHPQVMILTDDMYEHVWYADEPFTSFAEANPQLFDRTLTVNGCSKAYAMTGWRIGYAGGPGWLIKAMAKLQSQSTSNPCSIAQAAARGALTGDQDFLEERNAQFRERRDMVVAMLNDAPGLNCPTPDGAFYVFPDARETIGRSAPDGRRIDSDGDLTDYLIDAARVAAVPGQAFGLSPAFRISYATDSETLRTACARIQEALGRLR